MHFRPDPRPLPRARRNRAGGRSERHPGRVRRRRDGTARKGKDGGDGRESRLQLRTRRGQGDRLPRLPFDLARRAGQRKTGPALARQRPAHGGSADNLGRRGGIPLASRERRASRSMSGGTGIGDRGIGRRLVLAVPYLWLGLFFLAPLLIVLTISLRSGERRVGKEGVCTGGYQWVP